MPDSSDCVKDWYDECIIRPYGNKCERELVSSGFKDQPCCADACKHLGDIFPRDSFVMQACDQCKLEPNPPAEPSEPSEPANSGNQQPEDTDGYAGTVIGTTLGIGALAGISGGAVNMERTRQDLQGQYDSLLAIQQAAGSNKILNKGPDHFFDDDGVLTNDQVAKLRHNDFFNLAFENLSDVGLYLTTTDQLNTGKGTKVGKKALGDIELHEPSFWDGSAYLRKYRGRENAGASKAGESATETRERRAEMRQAREQRFQQQIHTGSE